MEERRRDRVRVDIAGDLVQITWDERQALLEKLQTVEGLEKIVMKFQAVGATRPVELDADERERLLFALGFWQADDTTLPDGIERLIDALEQDSPSE